MFSMLPLVAPHLKAGLWPQDNLQRLKSHSGVPVDERNRKVISRDFYGLTGNTAVLSPGDTESVTVQIGQDGDFWLNSMSFWGISDDPDDFDLPVAWGTVQIVDNSSDYKLFQPNVRLSVISGIIPLQTDPLTGNTTPNAFLQRAYIRSTIPQPYPMLRDSSMTVTIALDLNSINPRQIFFVLDGWKEFEYAS